MAHGLLDAVQQTVVLPVAMTALAAVCCLAVRPAARRVKDPDDLRVEVTSV